MKTVKILLTAAGFLSVAPLWGKTCTEILRTPPKPTDQSSIFRFVVTYQCEDKIPLSFDTLLAKHRDDILARAQTILENPPQQTGKLKTQEHYTKGEKGEMDLVKEYTLRSSPKEYEQVEISLEIKNGTKDLKQTRRVEKTTTVKALDGGMVSVHISQVIDIEKPWYAPQRMFETRAGDSLADNAKVLMDKELALLQGVSKGPDAKN